MLWHIGNTTVRTPYRLQEALHALITSPLNGQLSGSDQEQKFAEFLHENEIAHVARVERGEDASDLGRKWRAALSQLGFLTPQFTRNIPNGAVDPDLEKFTDEVENLTGLQYEITPNGRRLAEAASIMGQQECFLRALTTYQIPSRIENRYETNAFHPLVFVIEIVLEITARGESPLLSFEEFALFVQTSAPNMGIGNIVDLILDFRSRRIAAKGKVRAFDRVEYEKVAKVIDRKADTLDDYADLSFRYLKATGLFRNSGRGIAINPNKAQLATLIVTGSTITVDEINYFHALWQGASLPTDDLVTAQVVLQDLITQLNARGVSVPSFDLSSPLADIEMRRHELEERLLQLDEEEFAAEQANAIDEIDGWLQALAGKGHATLPDGSKIIVPRGESPAYLEWAVWRAFLAINSLVKPPWEARNFKIDQDFLPVHCAPGGRPDMVFEFENAIIVVEVTLTSSSRQEAAEGEPVRRHVAQFAENNTKPVYGLFIAVTIDSNTAHTFSAGAWYLKDDSKISLNIVPLTLDDFRAFVFAGRANLGEMPQKLRHLIVECRAAANQDAPQWKKSIQDIAAQFSK